MNRRQKIIISVTGIFLVALILMGLTYAYFLTQITGNTKDKSISVQTANLQLIYNDGTNIILDSDTKLKPSNTAIGTKTFTVYNDGDSVVENYNIYLENVVNELKRKDDLVYTLTCSSDDEENSPCTNQIASETTFPSTNGTILKNTIAPQVTHTYTLTLKYKEMNVDQSIDMNKYVNAKVNIYDDNDIDKRLNTIVMKDTRITKNNIEPTFTGVETGEVGMYKAPDDYGDSWYFRGKQPYNYVNFAGFTWRIVRINGDGSIRLILDGTLDEVKKDGETAPVYTNAKLAALASDGLVEFNTNYKDNAYVGYMYGKFTGNSTSYDQAHKNEVSSTIKTYIDVFYEEYLSTYESNLADTLFCGDKTLSSEYSTANSGFGRDETNYGAYERLTGDTATPTLECAKSANNTYSRYTSESSKTTKGVAVNSDLTYPIGLLSADELVYAGAYYRSYNESYYLYDAYGYETPTLASYWWTMSPIYIDDSSAYDFCSITYGGSLDYQDVNNGIPRSRPVINLKADSLVSGGEGTYESPYTIKEIS